MKMSVGVSGNVPRLSISTILNDKLHLEYFREFLNYKDQRLITLHRGTVLNWFISPCQVRPNPVHILRQYTLEMTRIILMIVFGNFTNRRNSNAD